MERLVLKQSIVDIIKSDSLLYGKIGNELNISPASLPRLLYSRDSKLTQAGVLRILREGLNLTDDQILEEEMDSKLNTSSPIMQEK